MKKYKLIKQYPGSDYVGVVVSQKTLNSMYEGWEYNYYKRHVENNPEYWEEVIDLDYEIISYVAKDNPKNITTQRRGGQLHENYWKIHSVKCLLNREVFTVGDKIKVTECGSVKNIDSIIIRDGNTYSKEGVWILYNTGGCHLDDVTKVKQPIFLTHDGKDIFEGDTVWYVNKVSIYSDFFMASLTVKFRSDINAYFITKEDAEDYIERNKVLFTTADGVGIKKGNIIHGVYRTSNTISNTVVGNNHNIHEPFVAVFSTRAAAESYLVQKSYSLSIEDFWEFDSWGGSPIKKSKRLKRLVKERLNLK